MYVANIERDQVIRVLRVGTEVYAVNRKGELTNLLFKSFSEVIDKIDDIEYGFFVLCKEEE